jgi:hypothetical protein
MSDEKKTGDANAIFHDYLLIVMGQAYRTAGYELDEQPMKWAGGQFRFTKQLDNGLTAHIEFQHLPYQDTQWASGNPSRFRVTLKRSDGVNKDLSELVVTDFGVAILPSPRHWWSYKNLTTLGKQLGEAGSLAIGYGMPWLSGELIPPSQNADEPSHPKA